MWNTVKRLSAWCGLSQLTFGFAANNPVMFLCDALPDLRHFRRGFLEEKRCAEHRRDYNAWWRTAVAPLYETETLPGEPLVPERIALPEKLIFRHTGDATNYVYGFYHWLLTDVRRKILNPNNSNNMHIYISIQIKYSWAPGKIRSHPLINSNTEHIRSIWWSIPRRNSCLTLTEMQSSIGNIELAFISLYFFNENFWKLLLAKSPLYAIQGGMKIFTWFMKLCSKTTSQSARC